MQLKTTGRTNGIGLALVVVVALLSLVAFGCSGDGEVKRTGPRLNKDQLMEKGNAICTSLDVEVTAIIDELVQSDKAPTPKQSQEALREVVPIYEDALNDLKRLNPPEADEATIDQFIALNDKAFENLKEASKKPEQAQVFLNSDDDPFRPALEVADRYGLDGCGTGGSRAKKNLTDAQKAEATKITVTSTEYAYSGLPPQVPSGPVLFKFENKGTELHEMVVTKLSDGQSLEQLLALVDAADPASDVANLGFSSAGPEGSTELGVMTTPGNYAIFCSLLTRDGTRHYAKGLATTLNFS